MKSLGGGLLYYKASKGDYYGSRGLMTTKIWDSGWIRAIEIERSESESPRRSIMIPYLLSREGIQSLGDGFFYYLGPKSDYYSSRGMEKWYFVIAIQWRNVKSYKFPTKLTHHSYYSQNSTRYIPCGDTTRVLSSSWLFVDLQVLTLRGGRRPPWFTIKSSNFHTNLPPLLFMPVQRTFHEHWERPNIARAIY